MKKRGKKNKGQAWGIDLAVGLMIFTFGILIFFFYAVNRPSEAKENLESLSYEGGVIADSILSEGSPENWNSSGVNSIGILSENHINETKIEYFYNLSVQDYNRTRQLFNTIHHYYFSLSENISLSSGEVEGIGFPPSNENNLIKIKRFTIYKNKPSTAHISIWN